MATYHTYTHSSYTWTTNQLTFLAEALDSWQETVSVTYWALSVLITHNLKQLPLFTSVPLEQWLSEVTSTYTMCHVAGYSTTPAQWPCGWLYSSTMCQWLAKHQHNGHVASTNQCHVTDLHYWACPVSDLHYWACPVSAMWLALLSIAMWLTCTTEHAQ